MPRKNYIDKKSTKTRKGLTNKKEGSFLDG